jgi:hypothetical protein
VSTKKSKGKQSSPPGGSQGSQFVRLESIRPEARGAFIAGTFDNWRPAAIRLNSLRNEPWVVKPVTTNIDSSWMANGRMVRVRRNSFQIPTAEYARCWLSRPKVLRRNDFCS